MNELEDFEALSDYYMVVSNFDVFIWAHGEGVPVSEVESKDAARWRKRGLLYYSRSKQRYFLTEYSETMFQKVLEEGGKPITVTAQK